MALSNLLRSFDQVLLSNGRPAAGGKVFLFEPGTSTPITVYRDSLLIGVHQHPVRLSLSGRAEIWVTRDCDMIITDRDDNPIAPTGKSVNPDNLGGSQDGGLAANGSFENDANSDGVPDGWVAATEPGGAVEIDDSQSTDGQNSVRIVSTGGGGGSLTCEEFFPVNDQNVLRVNIDMRSDTLGVLNQVMMEWYDVSQVLISAENIFSSTTLGNTFITSELVGNPPAGARFGKLKLVGGEPTTPQASQVWFDRLQVFYPASIAGIFDNITIQNNEIISTNANGNLDLNPNGVGKVIMRNGVACIRSAGDTDAENRYLRYEHNDGTERALVGHEGDDRFILKNSIQGGNVGLTAVSAAGVERNTIDADPDGAVVLQYAGESRFYTAPSGRVGVRSNSNDDDDQGFIEFARLDGTRRGFVGSPGGISRLELRNEISGGEVSLLHKDAADVVRFGVRSLPDAESMLYHAGVLRLLTGTLGRTFTRGDGNDDTTTASNVFVKADGSTLGEVGFTSGSDGHMYYINRVPGQLNRFYVSDAGGVPREMIRCTPQADVVLWHDATPVAATMPQASGGLHIRNTLTGSGLERVLTTSDLPGSNTNPMVVRAVRNTNVFRSNTAILAPDDVLQLPITAGRWAIEYSLLVTKSGPLGNGLLMRIGPVSGSISSHYYGQYQQQQPTILPNDVQMFSTSSTFGVQLEIPDTTARIVHGGAQVNCTSAAGVVGLLWSLFNLDSDTLTLFAGSWIKATKLS